MDEQAYTTQEVIEALESVGIAEEIVEYVVPILAYESRVDGVPFVNTAEDPTSPSYGLAQANVDSMSPAIYMALQEAGVQIPGITPEQEKQLSSGIVQEGEEDVRAFTPEQREFVINWFQNDAQLKDHALMLKHMLHQKEIEGSDSWKDSLDELYYLTTKKFNDPTNEDAQALKSQIEEEMKLEMSMEDTEEYQPNETEYTVPMPDTTPSGEVVNPETGRITGERILPHSGRKVSGIFANKFLTNLDKITRMDEPEKVTTNVVPGVGAEATFQLDEAVNKVFEFLRGR